MKSSAFDTWSREDFENGRILNVDKPMGLTSFGVVRKVRSWIGCRKVGHAGTLDPMATGVLLICTGRSTKQVDTLMGLDKVYEGTITLGRTTDTDDAEGIVVAEHEVPDFSEDVLRSTLQSFQGDILQIPPMFSALKKDGKRLYKLARKGITVERAPRRVHVKEIAVLDWDRPNLRIRVHCSKGTYIRSLARDIGATLKTGGTLTALRRMRVGSYRVEDAFSLTSLELLIREYAVV